MIGLRSLFGSAVLVAVVATPRVAAQAPDAEPSVDAGDSSIVRFDGCVDRLDVDEVRARVALELTDHPTGVFVHVRVSCASSEATVTVVEAGRPRSELAVDLGDARGTARAWALAIVVSDLLRHPNREEAASTTEAPTTAALESSVSGPPSTAPGRGASRQLASPIGHSVARAAPIDDGRLPDRTEPPPAPAPSTWLALAAAGRITLDGPTGAAGVSLSIRHHWFRVGLTVTGSHRGAHLGQVAAGILLLDVAAQPLRHRDGAFSLAGEIFVHGGALYGTGIPASASVEASETVAALVGFGFGARVFVAGPVGMELGLRGGYEVLGAELRAAATTLMRFYGLFASLDLAVALPLG